MFPKLFCVDLCLVCCAFVFLRVCLLFIVVLVLCYLVLVAVALFVVGWLHGCC